MGVCPNIGCGKNFHKNDMKSHLEDLKCSFQLVECRKCSFKGTLSKTKEHSCCKQILMDMLKRRASQSYEIEVKGLKTELSATKKQLEN